MYENNLILAFSGVVAFSTLVYALLTWRLVCETRKLREAQTEPRVSVRLALNDRIGHGMFEFVIRNEGQGPAQDIRFEFEGDPKYFVNNGLGIPIDEVSTIKQGLRYLGPNQEFSFILGILLGNDFDHAIQNPWMFHVRYNSVTGKSRMDTYVLDFSQFSGLILVGDPPLRKIEKHLKSLQDSLKKLATSKK